MTAAERAVLAVLQYEPKLDRINADYDKGRKIERALIVRCVENSWIDGVKKNGKLQSVAVNGRRKQRNGR